MGSMERKELLISILRDAGKNLEQFEGAVVLTGEGDALPCSIREVAAHVTLPGPSDEEFRELLSQITRDLSLRQHVASSVNWSSTYLASRSWKRKRF